MVEHPGDGDRARSTAAGTTVEVVRGRANRALWRFEAGEPRAVVRVGRGDHCTWRVDAPGVRQNHLMLLWNGDELAAVATGAGDVYIDDLPLRGARVLRSCRIELGGAALRVDAEYVEPRPRRVRRVFREALPDAATVAIAGASPHGRDDHQVGSDAEPTLVTGPPPGAEREARPLPLAPLAMHPPTGASSPLLISPVAPAGASSSPVVRTPRASSSPPAPPGGRRLVSLPLPAPADVTGATILAHRRPAGARRAATARVPPPADPYRMSIVSALVAAVITALGFLALL